MARSPVQKPTFQPAVEALEDRLTPDATSYVNGLYATVLHRTASQSDVNYWADQLNHRSQTQVAEAFWLSAEHRGLEGDQFYQTYLHRTESAADRQFWVNRFVNGGLSDVQMQIAFLTSAEYQALHPGTSNYIQALYTDVLGRPADANGLAFWTQQAQNGTSNANLARAFLASTEGQSVYVSRLYTNLLGRPADANGLNFWVNQLNDNDGGDTDSFNRFDSSTSNDNDNSQALENLERFDNDFNDNGASREEVAIRFLTSAEYGNAH